MAVGRVFVGVVLAGSAAAACNYDQLNVLHNDTDAAVFVSYTSPRTGGGGVRHLCDLTYRPILIRHGTPSRRSPFADWRSVETEIDAEACVARFTLPAGHSAVLDHHSWCSDFDAANWFAPAGRELELTVGTPESGITLRGMAVARAFERRSRMLCVFRYRG